MCSKLFLEFLQNIRDEFPYEFSRLSGKIFRYVKQLTDYNEGSGEKLRIFLQLQQVTWSPETHHLFPEFTKKKIFTLLCVWKYSQTHFSLIPREILFQIFRDSEPEYDARDFLNFNPDMARLVYGEEKEAFEFAELAIYGHEVGIKPAPEARKHSCFYDDF
jgi:hypothetical protein